MLKIIIIVVCSLALIFTGLVYTTWPFPEDCKTCVKALGEVPLVELQRLQKKMKDTKL